MNKLIEYIKIIGLMSLAFIISLFMVNDVFFINSPSVRPNFLARILTKTQISLAKLNPLKASTTLKQGEKPSEALKDEKSLFIMKGVYAKSAPNMSSTEFKVDEVDWVEYSFTLKDDRTIKVRVPKGQAPPTSDVLEYSQ